MTSRMLKRLITAAVTVLATAVLAATPASASTTAWVQLPLEDPFYVSCASGQATYTIYSGPYRGAGVCYTAHTNIYWRNGDLQRHHVFVIAPGGSVWNAVHITNWKTGATVTATGWKSLGGANLTDKINIIAVGGPGAMTLRGIVNTGERFCNKLSNNAWTGWYHC